MDWLTNLFDTAPFDMSRVGLWGLCALLLGALTAFAGPALWPKKRTTLKLIGLLLAIVGALGAMKII